MFLKVGQLAKQASISVRTLHHYDEIQLLSPSVRTPAGHRLYNLSDISRLHRIQALKQLGFSLQHIADIIDSGQHSLPEIINQQIENIAAEIQRAEQLKLKLERIQTSLAQGQTPDMANWLDTLALMNVYEKYLSPAEIDTLNRNAEQSRQNGDTNLPQMVEYLQMLLDKKVSPSSAQAKEFVKDWTAKVERYVGHNHQLLLKIHAMSTEPEIQIQQGITPAMVEFLGQAMAAVHRDIYTKYLTPEQLQHIDSNRAKNLQQWPPLIAEVQQMLHAGVAADSEAMRPLAQRWQQLFATQVSGGDPEIHQQLRLAYAREPLLTQGTGLDQTLLKFIRQAMDCL